ncbi:DUF2264 domain-containing protein [Microvirga sp. M2]|uniref:DUF2264 domain-containing protein n=1 Tax=Microvirga sp. M2 TaxID=3073270 RepID=UPI0039C265B9
MVLAVALALPVVGWTGAAAPAPSGSALDAGQVRATITRVGDWQLAHPVEYGTLHWAVAPLLDGLIDTSLTTGDPKYLAAVIRAGTREGWRLGPNTYHADDLAAGHAWMRIYLMDPTRTERLEPFKRRIDEILANPITENFTFSQEPQTPGVSNTDRWTWIDALYMAPPAFALLAQATKDERYLQFVDRGFKPVYDTLFDPQAKLFYRDDRFINRRTANGQKIFWSRGNGWVFAGLPLLLDAMPADYQNRNFYTNLFKEMAPAILAAQQPDGLWYPNLADPKQIPLGETSGSALFVFGMAWGIRHGLLDPATYWPAVERGWNGLLTQINTVGAVGGVQPIGAEPEGFGLDSRVAYGTGGVLMAGSEILRALGEDAKTDSAKLIEQADATLVGVPDLSRRGLKFNSPLFDRTYAVDVLTKIAEPVLDALSKGELKKRMPVHPWEENNAAWTHYEAFARTLAGIAPWLEVGPDDTPEGRRRARFIGLARQSLINATDPASPDFLNFGTIPDQPLVESGYLASALLAAPHQLWDFLDADQKANVLDALRTSRNIKLEHNNNWYLYPAIIEAALWQFDGDADLRRIEIAVTKFVDDWYLGDGVYGDGPQFHLDYYNSYVIHPMLLQVLRVARAKHHDVSRFLPVSEDRGRRYAEILERLISPEGTFPVMGRSSAYRFAAFYQLADTALNKDLPDRVDAGAVRAGLTNVIMRMVEAPGTFDREGWLNLGAVGSQPSLREDYNSTGSLYICLTGLVHLGLPADDPFWTAPPAAWTQRRIWAGEDVPRDRALQGPDGAANTESTEGKDDR